MVEQNSGIIEFYTNGYKTRVVCITPQKRSYMFQTSDDRYLERYWDWDNLCDRNEITSTLGNVVNPEWRKLNNEGCDLVIIRDSIAALNYNSKTTEIGNLIKEDIDFIVNKSRNIWSSIEYELVPDPVPMPTDRDITNFLCFNKISKYCVTLKRLTHDKIELVRRWRNDPKISQYMEFREEITPEMQEKWFRKIDTPNNLFFIIEFNDKEIGLINIKDISNGVGEGGVFIWDDSSLNSDISFRAHLALFDSFFENLSNASIISHVLKSNIRAQRFTRFLGFNMADNQENEDNQLYVLDKEIYLNNINRQRYINHSKKYNK